MKENNRNNANGKKRYTFRVNDEVMDLVYKWYQDDNCATLNEFIEKQFDFTRATLLRSTTKTTSRTS